MDNILETEAEVADVVSTQHLLEAMGFTTLPCQENYREEWLLDRVVYDFDTWPDLPTLLEIEGHGEVTVRELGLDFATATFGSVDEVYLAVLGRNILVESRLVFTG